MIKIDQLLDNKGRDIWSVPPEATVLDAIKMMAEKGAGALMVMEKGKLRGIFSERDYARRVLLQGRSEDTPVSEVMTSKVAYARPDQSVRQCLALMTEKRFRHLPVMNGDTLLGVISIGDLVKSVIEEQQHTIEELERYITG